MLLNTRFWTAEGTEQIRQEKAADIAQTLTKMKDKGDLNEKQQAFINGQYQSSKLKSRHCH
jgi:hypothetical protein